MTRHPEVVALERRVVAWVALMCVALALAIAQPELLFEILSNF